MEKQWALSKFPDFSIHALGFKPSSIDSLINLFI